MSSPKHDSFQTHIPALIQCCKETGPTYSMLMAHTINAILNDCGYSEERIKEHIQSTTKFQRAAMIYSMKVQKESGNYWCDQVLVGSHIEGSMLYGSSDLDMIWIMRDGKGYELQTLCSDSVKNLFLVKTDRMPPGYLMLQHYNAKDKDSDVQKFSETDYVSSKAFMELAVELTSSLTRSGNSFNMSFEAQQGPSTPMTITENDGRKRNLTDQTYAIQCHCPSLLYKWRYRRRPQNWPTLEVLDKVASLPVFAVPVAQKGTDLEHLQWRFCFNFGEIILVHSLNHTQLKVYILLKMIAKYLLKPICDDMTSFIMKNVVFWLAELKPVEEFTSATLLDRLIDALKLLRECIDAKQLNYYMIPERNLLAGKLTATQQCRLIDFLTMLITHDGQDYLKLHIPDENVEKAKQSLDCVQSTFVKLHISERHLGAEKSSDSSQSMFVKLHLPEENVEPRQSLAPVESLFTKLSEGNLSARSQVFFTAPFTVEQLGANIEKISCNNFVNHSPFNLHILPTDLKILAKSASKCGLKMFYDPLGVKHESVMDPALDVDDYDKWICRTCQHIALGGAGASGQS